ncbi:exosome complex exonuclease RRP46-like protein [Thalictrum thalictroides]|uniref:Exosome complex exonuclease RRP46-like protein n=1 Tax=Thalictrum thalictroides TaxID=46969 RepID=A0A7J6WUD8_THATH|nr:exosome complex exonuclease RRP46-like protein [Thalictrum thalictroides]
MHGFTCLVFPNSVLSILPEASAQEEGEKTEHGIITSVNRGVMSVDGYLQCLERGRSASLKMSDFLRRSLQSRAPNE